MTFLSPRESMWRMSYTVRRIRPADWVTLREVRLAALADAPYAFESTLAEAAAFADAEWQRRALRPATSDETSTFLAFDRDEAAVGMMRGELDKDRQRVWVYSVWVAPEHRGGVAARLLLDAVADWARGLAGVSALVLEVNETNARARAFYERCGFAATGRSRPHAYDPSTAEIELVKPLT